VRVPLLPEPGARRVYGITTLVNTLGFGLIVTSMVLYFTRVVHLSSNQVGLGMTVAGLVGLAAGVPIGDLACAGSAARTRRCSAPRRARSRTSGSPSARSAARSRSR
jgi:hypothetical protein